MPTLIQFRLEGKTYQMSEARKALAEQLAQSQDLTRVQHSQKK